MADAFPVVPNLWGPSCETEKEFNTEHRQSHIFMLSKSFVEGQGSDVSQEDFKFDNIEDITLVYAKFFLAHKCYDLVPTSAKLVVFDTQLNVKKSFLALVENGVRAAPLWDSKKQTFVGMLTITDFINILQKYYKSPSSRMEELEEHKIQTWRDELKSLPALAYISVEDSLFDAVCLLVRHRVHRLPVFDVATGNVMYILTHKRLLKFLFLYLSELPLPDFMMKSVREVNCGTFDRVITVNEEDKLITVINLFVKFRVSAVPVIDSQERLVDIYSKFDVINLAAERTYNNLDTTVRQALQYRKDLFEGVLTCLEDEPLIDVVKKIASAEVHRLVVINNELERRVIGLVSLSDLLEYLVLGRTKCSPEDVQRAIQQIQPSQPPPATAPPPSPSPSPSPAPSYGLSSVSNSSVSIQSAPSAVDTTLSTFVVANALHDSGSGSSYSPIPRLGSVGRPKPSPAHSADPSPRSHSPLATTSPNHAHASKVKNQVPSNHASEHDARQVSSGHSQKSAHEHSRDSKSSERSQAQAQVQQQQQQHLEPSRHNTHSAQRSAYNAPGTSQKAAHSNASAH